MVTRKYFSSNIISFCATVNLLLISRGYQVSMTHRETYNNTFCFSGQPSISLVPKNRSHSQNNASKRYLNTNVNFLKLRHNQLCSALYVKERIPQPPDIFWRRFWNFVKLFAVHSTLRCRMYFLTKPKVEQRTSPTRKHSRFSAPKNIQHFFENSSARNRSLRKDFGEFRA